jgi:DNA-directed RNA polymerase sigma subunit (sigma70/sigma32)
MADGANDDNGAEILREFLGTAALRPELDNRAWAILAYRLGISPRTLQETGDHFGLTRERIRQIEMNSMAMLRHCPKETVNHG